MSFVAVFVSQHLKNGQPKPVLNFYFETQLQIVIILLFFLIVSFTVPCAYILLMNTGKSTAPRCENRVVESAAANEIKLRSPTQVPENPKSHDTTKRRDNR